MNVCRAVLCLCVLSIAGQIAAQQSACTLPEPQYKVNKPNIFTEQQEEWLGSEQADQLESEYYLLPPEDSAELTRIGQKLLAQLPPTAIHFTFHVYLSDEANGFSSAGGYVYISSKMITDAHNEDELAAVLSHEIGHIYTHAVAITYTRELKALLKVDSVSDRADIADKLQRLINAPWKEKAEESEGDAELAETMADRIGLYAMTRAGYSPRAFAENLDRISDNHGRSWTFFRTLAGDDTSLIVRVRTAKKLAGELSAVCKSEPTSSSPGFADFQNKLRTDAFRWQVPATEGLKFVQLQPAMRPALQEIRFSPDGSYILAQEQSAVHILRRAPLQLLFTIDADNAVSARFSPDSAHVTLAYPSMRVERWSIATRQRESVHELIDYKGCPVNSLSPDGKTFVCIRSGENGIGLTFIDVDSEKIYYENKKWDEYPPSWESVKIKYSPDGRTMLLLAGHKAMAYDLEKRMSIGLSGALKDLYAGDVDFVGSNKLVFNCGNGQQQKNSVMLWPMCLSSFPTGEKLGKFQLGDQWVEQIAHGDGLLVGPLGDNAAVLIDPATGKLQAGFRLNAVDVYDQTFATESSGGGVGIAEIGKTGHELVQLPTRPLPPISSAGFSADGQFLAFSHGSRGSLWDLEQQKQVALMRPFTTVRFDDQNQLFLHLKQGLGKPGTNITYDLHTGKSADGPKFEEHQFLASGVLVTLVPLDKGSLGSVWNVEMRVTDLATGAPLWSRKFPHGPPDVYGSNGDQMVLMVDQRTETGDAERGHNSNKLIKTSDVMREWIEQGLIIEIVNARTGEVQRVLQTPTRPSADDDRSVGLYGDYLAVHGNVNNTVVYRVSDGARTAAFYGRVLAGDGKLGLLAVNNRDQEMIVYNAANGAEVLRVTLDHLPRAAQFIPATKTLMVLTATQRVYSIPLPDGKTMTAKAGNGD
jgi:hypothetical protein